MIIRNIQHQDQMARSRTYTKSLKSKLSCMVDQMKKGETIIVLDQLEKMLELEINKKPRKVSDFNRFVAEKMVELKARTDIPAKERLKECGRLWKEERALRQLPLPSSAPDSTDEHTPSCAH
jgi:hypothetical protein